MRIQIINDMDDEMMDKINKLNFDYIQLFNSENDKELYDEVIGELLLDCLSLKLGNEVIDEIQYYHYISKYSLFIAHFQLNENYEYCAEINKAVIAMISEYFKISRKEIKMILSETITKFVKIINNEY